MQVQQILVEQREQEMWRRMDVTGSSLGDGKPEGSFSLPLRGLLSLLTLATPGTPLTPNQLYG